MTLYNQISTSFDVLDSDPRDSFHLIDTLPPLTYQVAVHPLRGYYLQICDDFELPKKVYGSTVMRSERILGTFFDRPQTTGVLLSGDKGSGKTLLAKQISIAGKRFGLPTILCSQPWHGDDFNRFLQTIDQPVIMLFDEFEKVYSEEGHQNALLTLLDGTVSSKKLFVMTCNNKYGLSEFFTNRPGRFYYSLEYKGLEEQFIVEYCEDNLQNKSQISSIVRLASGFSAFNFDILKAIVEEMNRYGESVSDVIKYLNVFPTIDRFVYDIIDFKLAPETAANYRDWKVPTQVNNGAAVNLMSPFQISFECVDSEGEADEDYITFRFEDIVEYNPDKIVLENEEATAVIKRQTYKSKSYEDILL